MESIKHYSFSFQRMFWPGPNAGKAYLQSISIDSIYHTGARKATLQIQCIVWLDWYLRELYKHNQEPESASTSSTLRQMCCFVASNSERKHHFKSKIKCWISDRYPYFLLDPLWSGPPVTVSKCRMLMTWSPENSQLFTASHFAHARQHWDHGSNTWPHILVIYDPGDPWEWYIYHHLPTWMVDFYGRWIGEYTIHGWKGYMMIYLSILPKYYVFFSSLIIQVFLCRKLCPSTVFHHGTNRAQKTIPEIIKPEVITTFFLKGIYCDYLELWLDGIQFNSYLNSCTTN